MLAPKKEKPPIIPETSMTDSDCEKLNCSLERAIERDTEYFVQLQQPNAIEYSGYNTKGDCNERKQTKPKSLMVLVHY